MTVEKKPDDPDEVEKLRAEIARLQQEVESTHKQNLAFAADLAKGFAAERQTANRLTKTQEQLARSAKLATLGQMVAAVAHDVRNVIAPIGGYAELLLMDDLPESSRNKAMRIHDAADRATGILRSLTQFGSERAYTKTTVDINTVVKASVTLMEYNLSRKGVRLITDVPKSLNVFGDAGQLEQVIVNLLVNARQAMEPQGGELRIRAHRQNGKIICTVTDQGKGIPVEIMDKIFEPFFTTKSGEEGTGLGLFICHDIIDRHGGTIDVTSQLGAGTTFTIALPALPDLSGLDMIGGASSY